MLYTNFVFDEQSNIEVQPTQAALQPEVVPQAVATPVRNMTACPPAAPAVGGSLPHTDLTTSGNEGQQEQPAPPAPEVDAKVQPSGAEVPEDDLAAHEPDGQLPRKAHWSLC